MEQCVEYPHLKGGDVLILSPHGSTWNLSSQALCHASATFAKLINGANDQRPTKKQKVGTSTIRYRFKMVLQGFDNRYVVFQLEDLTIKAPAELLLNINGIENPPYIHTYDNLFRCLCILSPEFEKGNTGRMVTQSISLLSAAEKLGAANVVKNSVENQLLRTGKPIWEYVATRPAIWADIAIRLQSSLIFQEAMSHVIGAFNLRGGPISHAEIQNLTHGTTIIALAKEKIQQEIIEKKAIECQLVTFNVRGLSRTLKGDGKVPGRGSYASDIYYWLALSHVRKYITMACFSGRNHRALDGGASLYIQLAAGEEAYLGRDTLHEYHQIYPMTKKGEVCFKKALHYVKEETKMVVAPLFDASIQGSAKGLRYLVNSKIQDNELPWSIGYSTGSGASKFEAMNDNDDNSESGAGDGDEQMEQTSAGNADSLGYAAGINEDLSNLMATGDATSGNHE